MSSTAVLEARGVVKSYGRRRVLRGVDLTAGVGRLVGVIGENGSGKSTLLRILAGTLRADAGDLRLNGVLGYCPQEPVVNEALTVEQHLRYFAAAYRLHNLNRAAALLELLGFDTYRKQVVADLSGGTRQKLNLTIALMHEPDLLLLDEPYQGFDWETYLRFWGLADEIRAQGKTLLLVTHLVYDRARFDVLTELVDGRLVDRTEKAE